MGEAMRWVMAGVLVAAAVPAPAEGGIIPYWARQYDVPCSQCHVQPPMLNPFGEVFRARGYRFPGDRSRRTIPLAVWASARSDALHDEPEVRAAVRGYINKLELISGGSLGADWLSYFVEWRPISLETQRRDGVIRLRDRSGRFEDLFITAAVGDVTVMVGQYRQIDQVDVSLRLGLSEPLPLSAGLPGTGGATARATSLRGFSPSGRSPAVRVAWQRPQPGGWAWTNSIGVPLPGELSIPLTREARQEASNEIEWRAKGVVLESFVRRGLTSVGGHAFHDGTDRLLVNGVVTGTRSRFYWTAVGGVARQAGVSHGRWSLEGVWAPSYHVALGGRVEDRAGDGAPAAVLPYLRTHFPGTRHTFYLSVEQRIQRQRNATLIELGTVF